MNDLPEMDRILTINAIDVNTPLWKNLTAIWYAAMYGHFEMVQHLILRGALVNIYDNDLKKSCLDIAQSNNHKRTAYLLMAYNAKKYVAKKVE